MTDVKLLSTEEIKNIKEEYFTAIESNDSFKVRELLMTISLQIWEFVDNDGNTGLINACNKQHFDVASAMLEIVHKKIEDLADFKKWVNLKSDNGFNALHYSAYRGNLKMLKLLTQFGCNINIKNDNGLNAMHLATQGNQVSIMVYLKELHNYSYFCLDNGNSSPVHWAAYSGCLEAFDFLVAQGANINAQDKDGFTPLHLAALAEKRHIIGKLLRLGADYTIKDNQGRQPKDICFSKSDTFTMSYIEEKTKSVHLLCEGSSKSKINFVYVYLAVFIITQLFTHLVVLKSNTYLLFE